ncbi:hypothetical protein [Salmonirosea aquatica]|uniref:Uncharacterized protein n=1 Tax=Salmonirosea aquatica TaxID=2654236 RepID=A0A7C9BIT7_9BACT|nr:hypothetical protein [Cytophagaceae bacterium SJW1-29]MPR37140.1 hypothetical protein [Cytophagaceae bacterium SJW1-29]
MTKEEFLFKAEMLYDRYTERHDNPATGFVLIQIHPDDSVVNAGGLATVEQLQECILLMEGFVFKSMTAVKKAAQDGDPKGLIVAIA